MKLSSDPPINNINASMLNDRSHLMTRSSDGQIETVLNFPFQRDEFIVLHAGNLQILRIDISTLFFTKDDEIANSYKVQVQDKEHLVKVLLELRDEQNSSATYRLDISATGLPFRSKCFSCFPSVPLTFYEIRDSLDRKVYESEVAKAPSSDPFWMPSEKID